MSPQCTKYKFLQTHNKDARCAWCWGSCGGKWGSERKKTPVLLSRVLRGGLGGLKGGLEGLAWRQCCRAVWSVMARGCVRGWERLLGGRGGFCALSPLLDSVGVRGTQVPVKQENMWIALSQVPAPCHRVSEMSTIHLVDQSWERLHEKSHVWGLTFTIEFQQRVFWRVCVNLLTEPGRQIRWYSWRKTGQWMDQNSLKAIGPWQDPTGERVWTSCWPTHNLDPLSVWENERECICTGQNSSMFSLWVMGWPPAQCLYSQLDPEHH